MSKLQKGWKPGLAPVSYMNDKYDDKGAKEILVDEERFAIVRKVWDLMLTGNYNPRQLHELATREWHLTTRERKAKRGRVAESRLISHNGVYRLLTNIFYAGIIDYDGTRYKGNHKPMITIEEFDRVQRLLGAKGKPQPKTREFSFTGNIRCGHCGCLVTAETKSKYVKASNETKSYTYYRCTRRKTGTICTQKPIKLRVLKPKWISCFDE